MLRIALAWVALARASEDCSVSLLQLSRASLRPSDGPSQPDWPQKNGGPRRQGVSSETSTLNLTQPAWTLEAPGAEVFYASPVLAGGNVYISATGGRMLCLSAADGSQVWAVQVGPAVPTPILLGDSLYVADGAGSLLRLAAADGREIWRVTFADGKTGGDAWSMGGDGDVILTMGSMKGDANVGSGSRLFALNATDGRILWSYAFPVLLGPYNAMPSIVGDAVFMSDRGGSLYSWNRLTGKLLWRTEGSGLFSGLFSFTTGGSAVGPNNLIYVTSNVAGPCPDVMPEGLGVNPSNCGHGKVKAYDLSGQKQWSRTFENLPANNAPVVFEGPDGLTVVVGLGRNPPSVWPVPELDATMPAHFSLDKVVALDASNGQSRWEFQLPDWPSLAGAGSTKDKACWPDTFSNAAVDAKGTVYIGNMGGGVFALDGGSGALLGQFDLHSSIQGQPALADGLLVVASCNTLAAFHA